MEAGGWGWGRGLVLWLGITLFSQKHSASTDSWLAWGSRGEKPGPEDLKEEIRKGDKQGEKNKEK